MEIRKATINDLQSIQELNLLLFEKEIVDFDNTLDNKWTFSQKGKAYFRNSIESQDNIVLVAVASDKIIGYLSGGICKPSEYRKVQKMSEPENMFILEDYRSQGIGSKLFAEFLNWSKDQDVKRVKIVASAGNEKAIKFYKKYGFEEYDIVLECDLNK